MQTKVIPGMNDKPATDVSFFPGCTLATTATESKHALTRFMRRLGYNLVELEDFNCCGSSSAHSIDREAGYDLASRNLSLAPEGRTLIAACPNCLLRLRETQHHLKEDKSAQSRYERMWKRPFDPKLEIKYYLELLNQKDFFEFSQDRSGRLKGLKFAIYYGCTLASPPALRQEKTFHGVMERMLSTWGAIPVEWPYPSRCCGAFLSVARPDIATPIVQEIVEAAKEAGADCIITPCAMCHLNLEVRCNAKESVPILHFSEVLSLAMGEGDKAWFSRHLVDPRPLLESKGLLGSHP